MEAAHEDPMESYEKDQNQIMVKGKRTKRQRPQSPIPFAFPANSSPTDDRDGAGYCSNGDNAIINNGNTNLSPPSSSDRFYRENTEEEEDLANCLILLSQGRCLPKQQVDQDDKFTSRKYLEVEGYYVYECKTCGKNFPSFQALGGHRASHKKPKNMAAQERRQLILSSSDDEDVQFRNINLLSPLSLRLNNRGLYSNANNDRSSKTHECAICGAEFASGQALGGHMRRHRGPVNAASTVLSLNAAEQISKEQGNVVSLDLDLNLPASEDDHHRESEVPFATQQQQQRRQQQKTHLALSSSALVDCHY